MNQAPWQLHEITCGVHFKTEVHIKIMGSSSCKAYEKSDLSNTAYIAIFVKQVITMQATELRSCRYLPQNHSETQSAVTGARLSSPSAAPQPHSYTAFRAHTANTRMGFHCRLWVYSRLRDAFTMQCPVAWCRRCRSVCPVCPLVPMKHVHDYKFYQNSSWTLWSHWCFSFWGSQSHIWEDLKGSGERGIDLF